MQPLALAEALAHAKRTKEQLTVAEAQVITLNSQVASKESAAPSGAVDAKAIADVVSGPALMTKVAQLEAHIETSNRLTTSAESNAKPPFSGWLLVE